MIHSTSYVKMFQLICYVPGQKFENSYRLSEELITILFHLCDLMKFYFGVELKPNVLFLRNLFVLQKVDTHLKRNRNWEHVRTFQDVPKWCVLSCRGCKRVTAGWREMSVDLKAWLLCGRSPSGEGLWLPDLGENCLSPNQKKSTIRALYRLS